MWRFLILVAITVPVLGACGQPDGEANKELAAARLPTGVIARKTCMGGHSPAWQETLVRADGLVETRGVLEPGVDAPYTVRASERQLKELHRAFATAEWRELGHEYGRRGADARTCRITGGGKEVASVDGMGPAILSDVQSQFRQIEAAAQPIIYVTRIKREGNQVQTIRIFEDGTVQLLRGYTVENQIISRDMLPTDQLRRLLAIFRSRQWGSMRGPYDEGAKGRFQYRINGLGSQNIVLYTEGKPRPHPLDDVLGILERYWQVPAGPDPTREDPDRRAIH